MSHFPFTVVSHLSFHTPGISIRSMCIGACHACTASLCDLRDPGWGDPGFRHRDFLAWHPKVHPVMLMIFLVFTIDDLLRTGHTSSLVITFQAVFDGCFCAGCASVLFFCFSSSSLWNEIILLCTTNPGSLPQYRLHLQ